MTDYQRHLIDEDKRALENNRAQILLLARENKVELTEDALRIVVLCRTPDNIKKILTPNHLARVYELPNLLLAIIDTMQKESFLKVSSPNDSFSLQDNYNLTFLRKCIDKELSTAHPTYVEELRFPLKKDYLYSREQVEGIRDIVLNRIDGRKQISKIASLPVFVYYIVSQLKNIGVFDNKYRTLKANEAEFLYDTLILFNAIPVKEDRFGEPPLTRQEKYQKIKEYQRTFEKREKAKSK